jgi:hypothetical protein
MNRFSLALVAATTAAIAATGVMALSAVGDDQRPSTADRIKKQQARERGVAPAELLACLRARGLDPPTDPVELKMWIMRTPAAKPCIDVPKPEAGGGDCGAGKPAVVAARKD